MRSGVYHWRPKDVHKAVVEEVVDILETGGKMVEVDARRNLLRVKEPEFGRAYRRVLALYRLTSYVEVTQRAITAHVGIPRGKKGGDYGFWIEIGSTKYPPHPWLRPGLMGNLKNIMSLFK